MKTLLIILALCLTSFHIPVKYIEKPVQVQLYFIIDESQHTAIVYEYDITGDTIIPLAIPDHVMGSLIVK